MTSVLLGKQAIVMGGSLVGLAAARALADHFEQVIVIERDVRPTSADPRKGTPQSHHVHALLKSGELALEQLFPGFTDELVANGANRIDFSNDVRWFHGGKWKIRYDSGFKIMIQSRPLVEFTARQRVEALGNVSFYYGYEVSELTTNEDKSKITGVRIHKMDNRSETIDLSSDLVVDASGRGSKTPQWFEQLNYAAPEETILKIDLSYSSRIYEAPENHQVDWKLLVINPNAPQFLRAGYIFPIEKNRWLVTMAGYCGDHPPQTEAGFAEFSKALAQPDIYETMQHMKPITDVKVYAVPQTVRRHYEKLSRVPVGLIVMGDAFCAFDPVFGQGMSTGTKEAVALKALLAKTSAESLATLPQRFYKQAAQIVEPAWMLASSEDFRYPKTIGKKPFIIPILHWYSNHIFALSATDKEVLEAFREVMHLLAGAEALFKPGVVWKVLKHALRGEPEHAGKHTAPSVATAN